jgi:hypothetical protein
MGEPSGEPGCWYEASEITKGGSKHIGQASTVMKDGKINQPHGDVSNRCDHARSRSANQGAK